MFGQVEWVIMPKQCFIWGVLLLICVRAAAAAPPSFISIAIDNRVTGLSGDGSVAVGSYLGVGGFYWIADTGTVRIGGNGVAGVSGDGTTVVGRANDTRGLENAAIWLGGTDWYTIGSFTPEAQPCDQLLSSAYGVNGDGSVIVGLGWDGCAHAHGFRWDAITGMTDLGSLVEGRASRANAISGDGQVIAGWSDQATGFRQGARWRDGVWEWAPRGTVPF